MDGMKESKFSDFIKEIEDLRVQDSELVKKLKFFFDERGLSKKASYVFWILESIKKAKRYELLVCLLENTNVRLASNDSYSDAFQFYLSAQSNEVDSDLDYRVLQLMRKAEYKIGIDNFATTKRGVTPPIVEQTINTTAASEIMSNFISAPWKGQVVIPDSHANSILGSAVEATVDASSTKGKLPFCSRIRKDHKKVKENGLRRVAIEHQYDLEELISTSNLSNKHADVLRNEIEISPDCLRSFMSRKKHSNNELSSCSYDNSVVITRL